MSYNLCTHIFNLCQNASQLSARVNFFHRVGMWVETTSGSRKTQFTSSCSYFLIYDSRFPLLLHELNAICIHLPSKVGKKRGWKQPLNLFRDLNFTELVKAKKKNNLLKWSTEELNLKWVFRSLKCFTLSRLETIKIPALEGSCLWCNIMTRFPWRSCSAFKETFIDEDFQFNYRCRD